MAPDALTDSNIRPDELGLPASVPTSLVAPSRLDPDTLFRRPTTRKATALALVALLLSAVLPLGAVAQTGDYSGSSSGTVADVQLPGPGGSGPVHAVFAESTGAVNSQAGIIPDVPSTEADETQDFAVGTATPVRATMPGQRHTPGSVQSSAPGDASGSFDAVGPDPDSAFSTGHAQTSSTAAPDASTASTNNATSFTNGRFIFHLPLQMPSGSSEATVQRAATGAVTATGQAQLGGGSGQRISAFGGYVTAATIEALSNSTANGTSSANVIDFNIQDLRLGVPGVGGTTYITANAGPGPGDTVLLDVTIAVPGSPSATATITIPRGSNLLSAASYQGTTLAPAFSALTPYLNPLTGPTGPLHQLEIVLAAGFSDDGDGTYARGLVEAVRTSIVVQGALVAHTLGRAYSAADARRAFSTATDPALPPGTTPTSNAASAFPETRTASPTDFAFANDAQAPKPVSQPAPAEPVVPLKLPAYDEPVDEPADEPASDPSDPSDPSDEPAQGPVVAGATEAALPFTGLNVTTIAVVGLLLMALGGLGRWAMRRPSAPLTAAAARL
jgi:hypothetical protein